ncbi:MAG: hypothetical protein ACJ71N_08770 [Terriglobales bacterium]
MHPLTGSKTWLDMEGVTVVGKVWDGRANIAEYKADGPAGHMELIALRTYNPEAHQWNVNFATPNVGTFGVPCVGEFKNGRGEFYDQEQLNGKYIMVRFSIWKTGPDSAQSEQAFSEDGGKTWEVNWINKYKRLKDQPNIHWSAAPSESEQPGAHDFDFAEGTFHTHIKRTMDPFSTSSASIELDGTKTSKKIWGGRGWLEQIEAEGPRGHWEAMTIFLYNPKAHQWSQTYVNSKEGTISSPPTIGSFKDGRGELYTQDSFNDKAILLRGVWSDITPNSHRYEESYSDDGGRSWKTAFVGQLTRVQN